MIDNFLNYLSNSSVITILVLTLLSVYLITTFWTYFYKNLSITQLLKNEKQSLESLVDRNSYVSPLSALDKCLRTNRPISKERLSACEISIMREATSGISWLAIVSSTSPFIGLFGTVIGILESFAKFSSEAKVGFSVIAPAISEALVATAGGILVAIFAYTFHQLLTRKIYILNTFIKAQIDILVSRG